MRPTCIQICFAFLMIISLPQVYSQSGNNNPEASGLKKMEFNIFKTDFGYREQQINFKNWSLCKKYFHYKIFGYQGLKWEKMTIESRPNQHFYLDGNQTRFHIVFMNLDKKSSKLFFTIGKPPHYFYTGNIVIKAKAATEYLDNFWILSAYTLDMPVDGYHSTQYMIVFYTLMITDNVYQETNILLVCKTPDDRYSHSILPDQQISTTPYCFIDYNKDGWLDYVHFNPYESNPKVRFYDGNQSGFTINHKFHGEVTYSGDFLYELDRSKSNLPILNK